jgi:biopolymer transport protein TolR
MGMSTGGSGDRGAISEINVTPMVDVMLVLLIIFMVTAPLLTQGVAVELPQAKAQSMDVNPELMVLTLRADRHIFIGKTEVPYAELHEKLVSNVKVKKDKEVYLHADRSLPYGFVVDIMAIMKEAGVQSLGMVTDPVAPAGR